MTTATSNNNNGVSGRSRSSYSRGNNFLNNGNDPDIISPDTYVWETYTSKELRGLQPIIRVND